jgi:hypothetical protein
MRFMMIYKPADTKDMEAGVPPSCHGRDGKIH